MKLWVININSHKVPILLDKDLIGIENAFFLYGISENFTISSDMCICNGNVVYDFFKQKVSYNLFKVSSQW